MRDDLVTFREQLQQYPAIKKLLQTVPTEPCQPVSAPWRIYARRPGKETYFRRDFWRYKEAYRYLADGIKKRDPVDGSRYFADISITSKRQRFDCPTRVVKVTRGGKPVMVNGRQQTRIVPLKPPPGHLWCMYCRRFTIFTYFVTHHAFRSEQAEMMDSSHRRCCVCGVRESTGAFHA